MNETHTFTLNKRDLVTLKFALLEYEKLLRTRADNQKSKKFQEEILLEAEASRKLRGKIPHWAVTR